MCARFHPKSMRSRASGSCIDAEGLVLGRLATVAASLLRGKHRTLLRPARRHRRLRHHRQRRQGRGDRQQGRPELRSTTTRATRAVCARRRGSRCSRTTPRSSSSTRSRAWFPKNRLGRAQMSKLFVYAGARTPARAPSSLRSTTPRPSAAVKGERPCPQPLTQTTGRRKEAVARVRLRPGYRHDHHQLARLRQLLHLGDAPPDRDGAAAPHRRPADLRHRRHHRRRRRRRSGRRAAPRDRRVRCSSSTRPCARR